MAITRVLLKHLDSIVVDNEVTARRCIQYLYDQRMDRETFLPLNYLRTYPLKESLRAIEEPRNVKLAFDLIAFQPPEAKVKNLESICICCSSFFASLITALTFFCIRSEPKTQNDAHSL